MSWNEQERAQHGLTLRIADKWWHEALQAEVSVLASLTRAEWVVRPRLSYAVDDHVTGTIGADLFRGRDDTYFGQLHALSTGFVEVKIGF